MSARAGRGYAQGGLARLAQARQDRPGKGELDLTNIDLYGTAAAVLYLPAVPQKGRDIEIVLADGRQRCLLGLARLKICVNADRFRWTTKADRVH